MYKTKDATGARTRGDASEERVSIMAYVAQAPVHWLRGPHNACSGRMRQGLHAQAHTQHRHTNALRHDFQRQSCIMQSACHAPCL